MDIVRPPFEVRQEQAFVRIGIRGILRYREGCTAGLRLGQMQQWRPDCSNQASEQVRLYRQDSRPAHDISRLPFHRRETARQGSEHSVLRLELPEQLQFQYLPPRRTSLLRSSECYSDALSGKTAPGHRSFSKPRWSQPVGATPSDMNSFSKGGVYGTRKTGQAFNGAEDRHVAPLEGGRVVA